MVPFQTILLLLALLAAEIAVTGCSQKPPPGSLQPASRANQSSVDKNTGSTPSNTPAPPPIDTTQTIPAAAYDVGFSLAAPSAKNWTILISGPDAEFLDRVMKISAESDTDGSGAVQVKKGIHYECRENIAKKYLCRWDILAGDGVIVNRVDQPKDGKAEMTVEQAKAEIKNMLYLGISPQNEVQLSILLSENAQKIYNELTVAPVELKYDPTKKEVPWRVKNGTHIYCNETDFQPKSYACYLGLNSDLGSVKKTN